ncbi:UbiA prenyltransferase family protein, partial [Candidatus Gottesmanbacteria bacterium]|nr:UbiA prenyltransferase family protein [Candidatus Gottesmanbacteria bacterium]
MGQLLFALLKSVRPRQWLKNFALFTTILFTGQLFNGDLLWRTFIAFTVFCLLSSSNYIFNDILDAPKDRRHPFKRFRPIARGTLPMGYAKLLSASLGIIGVWLASTLGSLFFVFALVFLAVQYAYSLVLKHITVVDILTITVAYILRVYAGEAATGYHISIWLALAALSLALFLAIGKRRAELTLIQSYEGVLPKDTRTSLSHYSEKLLDTYTAMFANSTFLTYAFFTFLARPINGGFFFRNYTDFFADLPGRKWMM